MDYEWLGRVVTYFSWKGPARGRSFVLRLVWGSCSARGVRYAGAIPAVGSFRSRLTLLQSLRRAVVHLPDDPVTFLFMAVELALLDIARQGRPGSSGPPVLMVLWVNLHGGFALGMVLLAMAVVESLSIHTARRLWAARAWIRSSLAGDSRVRQVVPRAREPVFVASFLLSGLNPSASRTGGRSSTHEQHRHTGHRGMEADLHLRVGLRPRVRPHAALALALVLGRRKVSLFDLMVVFALGTATSVTSASRLC